MDDSRTIRVRVSGVREAARNIRIYEFFPLDGAALPAADAGSHIDLHLPNGLVRQYSLLIAGPTTDRYSVGIKRDEHSRGGSRYIHENFKVGDMLAISLPRNNFPLAEDAGSSILIAGGIGITPIWSMLQRLRSLGRPWSLHYSSRSRDDAAFAAELSPFETAHLHFDDEADGRLLDIQRIIADAPPDAHLYCCGPKPMLEAFEGAAAGRPKERIHVEYFSAKGDVASAGGFTVELAQSGKVIEVPPGSTILEALNAAGIDAMFSCQEGVCGACITTVISGIPDHRDTVLTDRERANNDRITICCSGSKSPRLVLDL